MLLVIGAFTIGLILSLLAFGVFISFRVFAFPDITADGSVTLGGGGCGRPARRSRPPDGRHCRGIWRWRTGRRDDRRAAYPFQDQRAAVGHPGDDGALFREPTHHGEEQSPALVGADARLDGGKRRNAVAGYFERPHISVGR